MSISDLEIVIMKLKPFNLKPVVESDGGRYEKDDGEDEIVNKRESGDWRA